MAFTIKKEYSKSTIKAPRNSAKTCPKLNKTSKRHDKHCCGILVVKLDRSHTNCNATYTNMLLQCYCSIYLKQKFVCRVANQLIFKKFRRNKKVYTKYKSEK